MSVAIARHYDASGRWSSVNIANAGTVIYNIKVHWQTLRQMLHPNDKTVSRSNSEVILLSRIESAHGLMVISWPFLSQPMMDRNKADELPKLQCGFIDFVCAFVYKVRWLFVVFFLNLG